MLSLNSGVLVARLKMSLRPFKCLAVAIHCRAHLGRSTAFRDDGWQEALGLDWRQGNDLSLIHRTLSTVGPQAWGFLQGYRGRVSACRRHEDRWSVFTSPSTSSMVS